MRHLRVSRFYFALRFFFLINFMENRNALRQKAFICLMGNFIPVSLTIGKQFFAFRKHFWMESFQWNCSDQFQAHQSVSQTHTCFWSESVLLSANLRALLPHAINSFLPFLSHLPSSSIALPYSFFPPHLTCHFTPCMAPQDTQHRLRTRSWEPWLNAPTEAEM